MHRTSLHTGKICTRWTISGVFFCLLLPASSANAQGSRAPNAEPISTSKSQGEACAVIRHNNWTVGLMGGLKDGAAIRFSTDIMSAVDDGDNMRVLPIIGGGMKQNILDLLYMKGVDITVTTADAFAGNVVPGTSTREFTTSRNCMLPPFISSSGRKSGP